MLQQQMRDNFSMTLLILAKSLQIMAKSQQLQGQILHFKENPLDTLLIYYHQHNQWINSLPFAYFATNKHLLLSGHLTVNKFKCLEDKTSISLFVENVTFKIINNAKITDKYNHLFKHKRNTQLKTCILIILYLLN